MKIERSREINFLEKIRLWWKFEGKYYHSDFIKGVKNIWRWLPVIWKDRDWDQTYIYTIIKTKLEFQANYIHECGNHVGAERDAERMRLVAKLIKLQQEDYYAIEYMEYFETEFEFKEIDSNNEIYKDIPGEKFYEMISEEITENFDDYFKKYPRQYRRVLSGEINVFNRSIEEIEKKVIAMEIAHENQERCKKLIFNIMNNHIERWWN